MAVVQAQVTAHATPETPVLLYEHTEANDALVTVVAVNHDDEEHQCWVERRLQDAAQSLEQATMPGFAVPGKNRAQEGSIAVKQGDTIYVYSDGDDTEVTFQLSGQLL